MRLYPPIWTSRISRSGGVAHRSSTNHALETSSFWKRRMAAISDVSADMARSGYRVGHGAGVPHMSAPRKPQRVVRQ